MVLKKNIVSIIVFVLSIFSIYSLDYETCNNPFDVSCIKFSNKNVIVEKQNITCNESVIENEYVLNNTSEKEIFLPIAIECLPLGFGRSGNDIIIPYDFRISSENKAINYTVYKNNTVIDMNSLYKEYSMVGDKIEIKFSLIIPKHSNKNIVIRYRNLQSGISQMNMKYWYKIHIYRNLNDEPMNISFIYNASKNSELYITSIDIKDIENEEVSKIINVERTNTTTTKWTSKLQNYNSRNKNEYLQVSFIYYDLGCADSLMFIGNNGSSNTIFWKNKDLMFTSFNQKDLFFLSNEQLSQLRNSFYANHGYSFKNKQWADFFTKLYNNELGYEYRYNPNFSESDFNEIEKRNIELIREMENINKPISLSDLIE